MTERKPPAFARWVFMHAYHGAYRDSLDADLYEEYQNGRSRAWFWREVCFALLIDLTRRLRDRSLSMLDAALGVFAMIALGLGTLTWAAAAKHPPPTHSLPCAARPSLPVGERPTAGVI